MSSSSALQSAARRYSDSDGCRPGLFTVLICAVALLCCRVCSVCVADRLSALLQRRAVITEPQQEAMWEDQQIALAQPTTQQQHPHSTQHSAHGQHARECKGQRAEDRPAGTAPVSAVGSPDCSSAVTCECRLIRATDASSLRGCAAEEEDGEEEEEEEEDVEEAVVAVLPVAVTSAAAARNLRFCAASTAAHRASDRGESVIAKRAGHVAAAESVTTTMWAEWAGRGDKLPQPEQSVGGTAVD